MNVTTDSSLWQRTNDLFFSLFLLLQYSTFKVIPIITSFSLSCILMSFLKWKRKKHVYSCSRISELREALCTVPPKTSCWYQWQLTLTDDFWTGTGLSTHPLPQLTLRAYERSISLSPFYKVEHRLRKAKWFAQGQQRARDRARAWAQAALSPKPTLSTTMVPPLPPKDVGFAPSQTTLRHCPSSLQWRLPIMEGLWAQQLCQDLRRSPLATWCEELTHWKRPWCWERLRAGGEGNDRGWDSYDRGWDGWMASPTQWTWVWVDSSSWW